MSELAVGLIIGVCIGSQLPRNDQREQEAINFDLSSIAELPARVFKWGIVRPLELVGSFFANGMEAIAQTITLMTFAVVFFPIIFPTLILTAAFLPIVIPVVIMAKVFRELLRSLACDINFGQVR